jgi:hypothetical protein
MSKIIIIEKERIESDRDRAPNSTETIYAIKKEEVKDSDELNGNETNNANA